jgi:hypothetical protein
MGYRPRMARITIEDDRSRDDVSRDVVKDENPVARQLVRKIEGMRRVDIESNLKVEEVVLKYGRPFTAVDRPKGFRLGAKKECFLNSYYAADKGQGFYVEGYGLYEDWLFQHAWITLDGLHAVDVTLRGSVSGYHFFGIPIPLVILRAEAVAREGRLPLLDHALPTAKMEDLLQRAMAVPPDYAPYEEPVATGPIM